MAYGEPHMMNLFIKQHVRVHSDESLIWNSEQKKIFFTDNYEQTNSEL